MQGVKDKIEAPTGNKPPVAYAGINRVIVLPEDSLEIIRSGTNTDGTIVNYSWRKISGPVQLTLINSIPSNIKLKNLAEGSYDFELKVTDNLGSFTNDTVSVHVIRGISHNQPPVANAGPDAVITLPVDSIEITGSGTDTDGSIINYTWTKISGPQQYNILNPNAATIKVSQLTQGGYTFQLAVTDKGGLIATDSMKLIVNGSLNQPPVVCRTRLEYYFTDK